MRVTLKRLGLHEPSGPSAFLCDPGRILELTLVRQSYT